METYTVAFVGLPSSGKSSLINSLFGKRILSTGICRTTTEVRLITDEIKDDAENKFNVIDLPGICDSEEKDDSFNKLTYEYITTANSIFWCSDVRNAFITSHEVSEFNKLKEYLNKKSYDNNKLYELNIILTKCSEIFDNDDSVITISEDALDDEIKEEVEETSIKDIYKKTKEKFSGHDIILFNAFGRSYHHPNSTITLKKFVEKIAGIPSKENINFSITDYILNYDSKNINLKETNFSKKMEEYISHDTIKFEEFIDLFDSCKNKEIIFTSLSNRIKKGANQRLHKIFAYLYKLYKESKFIANQKLFLHTYYDILFDLIKNNIYNSPNTISDIFAEMDDPNYFYNQENFIEIVTKKLDKCNDNYDDFDNYGIYYETNIFLNEKYSFSDFISEIPDKNYEFIKNIVYTNLVTNKKIITIIENWLCTKIHKLKNLDILELVNKNNFDMRLILNDLNTQVNNKYTILYSKIDSYNSIGKPDIMIQRIFQKINDTQGNPTIYRLSRLTEFKHIFRNCLASIYEYNINRCSRKIDDILYITPYTINEIIE